MHLKKHTDPNFGPNVTQWMLGVVKISPVDAIKVLGRSHTFEAEPRATAGGREEYWMFELDSKIIAFFNLQVPYSRMVLSVICEGEDIPEDTWQVFSNLFAGYNQEKFEMPFNASRPE